MLGVNRGCALGSWRASGAPLSTQCSRMAKSYGLRRTPQHKCRAELSDESDDTKERDGSSSASTSSSDGDEDHESPKSTSYEPSAMGIDELIRSDFNFLAARVGEDTQKTVQGLAFSHELLVSAFGRGQRPQLMEEMQRLREELEEAEVAGKLSQVRLQHTAARLEEMEAAVRSVSAPAAVGVRAAPAPPRPALPRSAVRNYWYTVAHASQLGRETLMPFDLFDRTWCLFRDQAGLPAVVLDECAHRGCPLSLGKNVGGRVQCPYHGWEYNSTGLCEAMPSCAFLPGVTVPALPVIEQDGFIWAWAGDETPAAQLPRFQPEPGFRVVAEVTLEVEADWGEVIEGLLDVAQQPELRRSQRQRLASAGGAEGAGAEGVDDGALPDCDGVECIDPWHPGREVAQAAARAIRGGGWDQSPEDVSFEPPCAVLSSITVAPGIAGAAPRRVEQLHVCLPGRPGRCRVLYRVSAAADGLDGLLPGMGSLWQALATELVMEEVGAVKARALSKRLVPADQQRGVLDSAAAKSSVWSKVSARYQQWRQRVNNGF